MTENRRFYYLKLKENFYNSETMVILESMQDGLLYSNLLLKMYLMSLKSNGVLLLNDYLPHTVQTIATFTRHQVGTVERALKIFQEFGLVEILTDGAYYMSDIQLLIGQSSSEGERKKKERMRLKRQNLLPSGETDICPSNGRVDKCPPILEYRDKEIRDKSIERGIWHTPMGDTGMCFYLLRNWQNSRRNFPLFGNSTLSGCPSTWNPAEKDIKTMRPQSGAGRTPTKRRRNRLPGTGITA